ncbi:N-acetylmuramoyl-L-alanine amidase [Pelotomaculum propionicicum]|uniref:N-acetylmuramoyl-L-alanine amidase n=1 Tax=Pelotomaculum propionicicum TaxID=258475 RepID=UPI003B80F9CD
MHLRYRVPSIFLLMLAMALFLGVLMSSANSAFADTAVVSTDILNIRAGPGTGYSVITQAGAGDRLSVLEKSGDWYCVSLATGQKGWLAGWLVSIEKSQAQAPQNVSRTAKVNGSSVNIRSGPGTGYNIVTQVGYGSSLPILGSSGDWYNVSVNPGGSGWIAGWLVSVVNSPSTTPSRSDTTGARNAVVTGSIVNVRGGPGTTNSVVGQVFQGNSLPVLEQSGDWYRVTLPNGSSGWVAGWLLSMQTAPANPPSGQGGSGGATQGNSGNTGSQAARGLSLKASGAGDKTSTVITSSAPFDYTQSFLANPDRLVVDLKGIVPGDLPAATNVNSKTVSQVRTGHFQKNPDVTRVVFDLKGGAQYDVSVSGDRKTLTVETYIPDIQGSYAGKIIAIDAGHGNPDPGATGKLGTKEKDITLDIAKRVAKLLEAKGAKVIMTRTGESEVGLYQRTSKANSAKANLFVSIHINANENAALGGTSTYVHSGAKTARVQESDRLARYIQSELVKVLGLRNIGVKYADFVVLRTSSMPAVLCELAFISNIPEEKYMNTDGFKNSSAEAIVKGIGIYFSEKRNA